jgi:PPP family 3-phenylpropionic acid transporter
MARNPQEITGEDLTRRLALYYAALFVTLGVQLPFLPIWLAAKGLEPQAIGIVLALPMLVRLFAVPMASRAADRHDALKLVIVAAAAGVLAGFGALGLATGTLAIAAFYAVASAAYAPLFTLGDVYALRGLEPHRRAYGPVRLWGSAAFIVASLGAGALLDVIAAGDLIWLIVAAAGLLLVAAWTLAPLVPHPRDANATRPSAWVLLRNPAFLAVAATASLVQASHALYYGFSTIDWQAAGIGGTTIGALWALGVLAEIVLFAYSARLPAAFGPGIFLSIGAGGAVVRWSAMVLGPPIALLPLLQCLHGLSFGATHLGALALVARAAPPGLAATSQGIVSIASGIAMAAATVLSGMLYASFGGATYAAMALIAGAGTVAALVAEKLTR